MHGQLDQLIPVNELSSVGSGPEGSLLSVWGWYFEEKQSLLDEWREAMSCDPVSLPYKTPYDGVDNFACKVWTCEKETQAIVSCTGDFSHEYPLHSNHYASAEIAFEFMKNHPRQ